MLSSLTVGEKQHPKLGGCVRVFFQLFDWNRRLSCKKRIFSQKQLPSERSMRRAFMKYKDGSGEPSCSSVDAKEILLITNGEEEDNLQFKEDCYKEDIIGEEGMKEESNDVIQQAVTSSGFFSENESFTESALKVKSPGVIGKLMGLESLPRCEIKQKTSLLLSTPTVIISQNDYNQKVHQLAFEHGLPDDELNALLAELNGNMSTILSALPPHIGISSRIRPSTTSSRTCSTTGKNSTMGVSSPCPCQATFTQIKVNAASSTCPATLARTQVSASCPATPTRTHVNLATGVSSTASCDCPVANKHNHLEGAKSLEGQLICPRDDLSEFEQQVMTCPRAGEGPNVGTIKRRKRMKGKSATSGAGKRLSEKSMNVGIYGASMEMNVQFSPQEMLDIGRTTCKPMRRKKVDTSMQNRCQDVRGSPSYQTIQCKPLQESGNLRGSPNYQAISHRKQEEGCVRGSPNDQSSCNLASRNAGKITCKHDPCLTSIDFAVNYNVGFFDEYHRSRRKLGSASNCKHSNDNGVGNAYKSKVIREALTDHDQTSLDCSNAATNSGAKEESLSFIRVLMNRRAAREAAATAAIAAAGILQTTPPMVEMPALPCNSVESLQSMISSCSIELDTNPKRREKLSAGRSEAGGGDFIQIVCPIKYSTVEGCGDAACCMSGECVMGDSDDRGAQRSTTSAVGKANAIHRGMCMQGSSMACTKESAGRGGVQQLEICGTHAGTGKNTTAAILQDVISALSTPVSSSRPRHHHHLSDDDGGTPSTADGHDTESTSSGGCWAAASQPSPVSVLISPFDDDVSAAGDDACWIQSEDDYVVALLAATSENGKTNIPPAELFGKLEERVIAAWPDSEVPPTRGYRRLVFDCVCEAMGQAAALKDCRGNRRWRARVLFEEMCRWRQGACDIVLDDLVEADLGKACNRWVAFEVQTREIAALLERTIFDLLVEDLVCDLVLSIQI